jgi:hypothetical protein
MFEKRAKLGFHDLPREWVVHLFGGLQVEDGAVPLFRFQGYSDILKVKPVQRSLSNDIASGMLLSPDVVSTAIARPELQVPDTHPWAVLDAGALPFHALQCSWRNASKTTVFAKDQTRYHLFPNLGSKLAPSRRTHILSVPFALHL